MSTEMDNLHEDADGKNENNIPNEPSQEENKEELVPQDSPFVPEDESSSEKEKEIIRSEEVEDEEISEENLESPEKVEPETFQEEENSMKSPESDLHESESDDVDQEDLENSKEEAIPLKNYDELSLALLITEAKSLLSSEPINQLREHFFQIREAVKKQLEEDELSKKEQFIQEGGEEVDFHYDNPARREFNAVFNEYRKKLDTFHKEQEIVQKKNLEDRLQIIDELKALYLEQNDDSSNIFTQFRKIKTRWHNAGPVPKGQAGNVFRTYFHHLDNFYEYLDLNKELREMDYAHNLQVRESIIKRAEELVEEENVQKALNELQYLHRLWKEEAVPVAEDMREPTWQKFKELTQKIHERKFELGEKIKVEQEENLRKKEEILDQITQITENAESNSHAEWQVGIKNLNALREQFLSVGRVPRESNQKMWDAFKSVTRDFNHKKNEFYKTLKNEQQENLEKKQELLRIAQEHAQSSDWNDSVQIIKKIQADWKKIGHVPRKYSDSIWKEFKKACNDFFDRYKNRNSESNEKFEQNLVKKEALLEELKEFKPTENNQENLDTINQFTIRWNSIGKVPLAKMSINQDFNKQIAEWVKSMGLSKNEIQDFKMASLVDQIKSGHDERLLDDEIRKTRKNIDDLEKEINQLETNIGFFANADANNPLLKDVFQQIEEKRNRLVDSEIRLRKLHQIDFDEEIPDAGQDEEGSSEDV